MILNYYNNEEQPVLFDKVLKVRGDF